MKTITVSTEIYRSRYKGWFRQLCFLNGTWNVVSTWIVLGLFIALALVADILPLQNPTAVNASEMLQPPSSSHWFGTDPWGMDVFSRTICAIRVDFLLAVSSVILGILAGVPLGAIAGFFGGFLDDLLTRFAEVIQSFPQMLFGMAVLALLGNNIINLIFICAFYNIPTYARLVRSVVSPLREADFVQAAKVSGNTSLMIVFRHLIPNALVPVFSQFPLSCAWAIQIIAGLSFIGLGIRAPTPEWGSMINLGANYIVFGKWWPSVFPGLAIVISVWMLSNLGNQLKSIFFAER